MLSVTLSLVNNGGECSLFCKSFLQKEVVAVSLSIIQKMNEMLLTEMPEYRAQAAEVGVSEEQRRLLRALMNVRPPRPLSEDFLALQD